MGYARVVAGSCVTLLIAAPLSAATRVSIRDLKEHPSLYYDESVSIECYYDKESPIWVSALPDADEWIGFFVTGKPEKSLTWSGEYYNLLFAPRQMQEAVRQLRGGDKITVVGEAFPYHSASLDGGGIRVRQILQGWGSAAKAIGNTASSPLVSPPEAALASTVKPTPGPVSSPLPVPEKYAVTINGKRYEGLRMGDQYNFDGIEFQVNKTQ